MRQLRREDRRDRRAFRREARERYRNDKDIYRQQLEAYEARVRKFPNNRYNPPVKPTRDRYDVVEDAGKARRLGGRDYRNAYLAYRHAKNCDRLAIEHIVLRLPFIHDLFNSTLLQGAEAIPEGHYTSEDMRSTVVPFRNGIMLAIAAGIADSRGLQGVLIANHSGDHAIYPDCRPEFVTAMDTAIKSGTNEQVALVAPYTALTKADIARRGAQLGVDYSLTYSCYKGGDKHCGRCGTCVERKEAFREAGIEDPTNYED